MKKLTGYLIISFYVMIMSSMSLEAKKIKNSFKIEKKESSSNKNNIIIEGLEINLSDSIIAIEPQYSDLVPQLQKCVFAGYDKEISSNIESFILVNPTSKTITGFDVKIDYLDMQGRMFHSREVKKGCNVPPGESRRIDIGTWDKQHTYYYYLGNQPRRVATPFQVSFHPVSYWVED